MKKNELQKILKPLIKECIKEVIFEDGQTSQEVSALNYKKMLDRRWKKRKEN